MNFTALVDLIGVLFFILSIFIIVFRWKNRPPRNITITLLFIIFLTLFFSLSNFLEWSGLTISLDKIEDYLRILEPILWGILFYSFSVNIQMQSERRTKEKLMEREENLRITLNSIGDAVIVTDLDGKIVNMNPIAEELTGWKMAEAEGKPLEKVFRIYNALTDEIAENPVQKVLRTGKIVSLANHTKLISKNGKTHQISDSGSPIKDESNNITGVVLVFRDVTSHYEMIDKMQQSEKTLRSYIENSPIGFFVVNNQGDYKMVNKTATDITGYSQKEILSMNIKDFMIEEEIEVAFSGFHQLQNNVNLNQELHFKKKDGSINIWSIKAVKINDDNYIGFVQDITEKKQIELDLQKSKERFELAMNTTNDGLWDWNMDTNKIYYSPGWKRMLGYADSELPNDFSVWEKLTDEADVKKSWNQLEKLRNGEIDKFDVIFKMKHKEGHDVHIRAQAQIYQDENGKNNRIVGTHTDITKQHQAEQQIREVTKRYQKILDTIPDLVSLHDKDFNIIYSNWHGFGEIDAEKRNFGEKCYQAYRHIDKVCDDCQAKNVLETREIFSKEVLLPEGKWVDLRVMPIIEENGKCDLFIEWVRDITDNVRAQEQNIDLERQLQQSHKMEAIGTLTGGIAHDFNNLLTPIVGYSDLMKTIIAKDDKLYDYIEQILSSSHKAKELIDQLLTFSRKKDISVDYINIVPAIKESLKLLRSSLPASIDIKESVLIDSAIILANPTQIHQIVMNLCINAFHAMQDESGYIENGILKIELSQVIIDTDSQKQFLDIQPGKYLQLIISDNGKGMDKEVSSHIFEPFYTTKSEGKGTGMGLAVVHGIIKDYKGAIRVDSEPGKGTTFTILFPLIEKKEDFLLHDYNEEIRTGNGNIFVVDDRKYITDLIEQILERYGYQVKKSNDSKIALQEIMAEKEKVDLIISDLTMPGISGVELAHRLRKNNLQTPIILLTGYGYDITKSELERAKFDGILKKPIEVEKLITMVQKLL